MYMHVAKELDLTFLDSLNFLGMRLSKLPGCFDLKELCKGYFPHLFNTSENQHYVGPYPDIFERVRSAWYRLKVMRPETISACPPSSGWNGRWQIKTEKKKKHARIRHALNGGEHRVSGTRYRLDGYHEEFMTAYGFLGEVFF